MVRYYFHRSGQCPCCKKYSENWYAGHPDNRGAGDRKVVADSTGKAAAGFFRLNDMRTSVPLFEKTLYSKQEWNILTKIYCGTFWTRIKYQKVGGKKASDLFVNKIHRDFVKEVNRLGDEFECPICEETCPWDYQCTYPNCKPGCDRRTFCMTCALISDQETGFGPDDEEKNKCPGKCKTRSRAHRVNGQVLRATHGFAVDVVFSVAIKLRTRSPPPFLEWIEGYVLTHGYQHPPINRK
jgi:hypothetical protein